MTSATFVHPIDNIVWRMADELRSNSYNPNVVMNQELNLLEFSLLKNGYVQPALIAPDDEIIDGFHRVMLAKTSPKLRARDGGRIPCAVLHLPRHEAMMLTVRINRAKGSHVAVRMSDIVQELINDHGCDRQEVATGIGATLAEVDLLLQNSIFEAKGLKEYRYSRAWVPREVPAKR